VIEMMSRMKSVEKKESLDRVKIYS